MIHLDLCPTMEQLCQLAENASADERDLYERFSGEAFNASNLGAECAMYNGPKWIGVDGDKLVAAGGFIFIRRGVVRTWFLHTPDTWKLWRRETTFIARHAIDTIFDQGGVHRVECMTAADNSIARRWYGKLGLEFECILGGFMASGEDVAVYVRRS